MHGHRTSRHHHRHAACRPAPAGPAGAALIPTDEVRASDAERERVVAHLRDQAGEGRLTVDELDTRLDAAYAARTRAELATLTTDLPRPRRTARTPGARRDGFPEHLRAYLLVMALLVGIWAATGAGYPWPIWPALGWGIGLLSHASATRRPRLHRARG